MSELQTLLSVQDVAKLFGVSRAAVYTMIKNGDLKPIQWSIRKPRFRVDDIEALLSGSTAS